MPVRLRWQRKWLAIGLIGLVAISMLAASGCTALNSPSGSGSGNLVGTEIGRQEGLAGSNDLYVAAPAAISLDNFDFVPKEIAPTFTEKPFWMVLGLVVLGWIIMAADYSDQ